MSSRAACAVLPPDGMTGLKNLVSLVGPSWARLLMYTGMRIDSAEAVRIGLVDRVVPDAELWNSTLDIARTISGNAPLAIQAPSRRC